MGSSELSQWWDLPLTFTPKRGDVPTDTSMFLIFLCLPVAGWRPRFGITGPDDRQSEQKGGSQQKSSLLSKLFLLDLSEAWKLVIYCSKLGFAVSFLNYSLRLLYILPIRLQLHARIYSCFKYGLVSADNTWRIIMSTMPDVVIHQRTVCLGRETAILFRPIGTWNQVVQTRPHS